MKTAFIGCGNMASAIIGGLIRGGVFSPEDIAATARTEETRQRAHETFGIRTLSDNKQAAAEADVVVLAVKPQVLTEVLKEIRPSLTENQLIISLAAGRSLEILTAGLGENRKIVRVMPNTPALVGEGMTAWSANAHVEEENKKLVRMILGACGKEEEVPEKLIDSACCVSGCGPAYVYLFIEALSDAAVAEGMPRAQAYRFAAQTLLGSAKMVLETGRHPGELKDMVTSPGGSTIAGIKSLEEDGFRGIVMDAIAAASERSRHM